MSLHIRNQDTRTPLQDRISKDLQERARQKAADEELPDGVDDSRFIEKTKQTTGLAWAWILIGIAAVVIVVWLVALLIGQ